jgi:hypothetical protein
MLTATRVASSRSEAIAFDVTAIGWSRFEIGSPAGFLQLRSVLAGSHLARRQPSVLAFVDKCNNTSNQLRAFEQWDVTLVGHLN